MQKETIFIRRVIKIISRRKWRSKEVTDLGPKDLEWMHDEIDRINTQIMEKYNLKDKSKRNDKRVTKELKDLKVEAVHIGGA